MILYYLETRRGGVYPPGAAFARTSLIERLRARGIHFEVTGKS